MKITFKNVGQGDSILLEWEKDGIKKLGIVDCNLSNGQNPVLNYIKAADYSEIEFIILSHPHYDHFSGLRELLTFCEDAEIQINRFLHTSQQVPAFLRVATNSVIAQNELSSLFRKVWEMRKKGAISFITYISDDIRDLSLNDNFTLKFLSPSSEEYEKFLSRTPLFDEEESHNNSQANWLSTIIKIYAGDEYILLTSDSSIHALKRIGIQQKREFTGKLVLGQSPHHGAKGNHYNAFWKTKEHKGSTPIVFSVGQNIYKHPSEKAVGFFSAHKNGYKIFSTNQIGSLARFDTSPEGRVVSAYLDLAGSSQMPTAAISDQYHGDQTFSFKPDN